MESCTAGFGTEIPVRREQGNPECVIISADRDDCCVETWKLITDGSGNVNSSGYYCGSGSRRHEDLVESEF